MQKDITRSTQTTSYVRTSIVDNEAAGTDFHGGNQPPQCGISEISPSELCGMRQMLYFLL